MYISVDGLRRQIYNVLLFTPGKGDAKRYPSEGLVAVTIDGNDIAFITSDSYTVMESGPTRLSGEGFWVTGESLKTIEKGLRDAERDEVEVNYSETQFFVGKNFVETVQPTNRNFWKGIWPVLYSDHLTKDNGPFAIDGRRLQKMSLLEPRDTYPIDIKRRESENGQPLLVWKHGPISRGIIAPLDRAKVWEAFGAEEIEDVLWK